jgi:hypothetical protein
MDQPSKPPKKVFSGSRTLKPNPKYLVIDDTAASPAKEKAAAPSKKKAKGKGKKQAFKPKFTQQEKSVLAQAAGIITMCSDPASRRWAVSRITSVIANETSFRAAKPKKGKSAGSGKAGPGKKRAPGPVPIKSDRGNLLTKLKSLKRYFAAERSRAMSAFLELQVSSRDGEGTEPTRLLDLSLGNVRAYHRLLVIAGTALDMLLGAEPRDEYPGISESAKLKDNFMQTTPLGSLDMIRAELASKVDDPDHQLSKMAVLADILEEYRNDAVVSTYVRNHSYRSSRSRTKQALIEPTSLEDLLEDPRVVQKLSFDDYTRKVAATFYANRQAEAEAAGAATSTDPASGAGGPPSA